MAGTSPAMTALQAMEENRVSRVGSLARKLGRVLKKIGPLTSD